MTDPTIEVWSVIAAVTVATTTLALFLVRPMLLRRGMVDTPNHRSSHLIPTVRGGGIGVLIGLFTGWVGAILLVNGYVAGNELGPMLVVVVVVCLFGVVGWLEDRSELTIRSRLAGQCALAILAAIGLGLTTQIPVVIVGLTIPAIVFYVNAANFMDGINGISGQHGVVVASYFGLLSWRDGEMLQAVAACVLGFAFFSFLPWNMPKALMFLGDSGSYLLGAAAVVLATWTMTRYIDVLVLAAPLMIYAADVIYTLVRRVLRQAPLFMAHREHVYQRLQQATASHTRAALVVTALSSICGAIGFMAALLPTERPVWYACVLTVIVIYLTSPRWIGLLVQLNPPTTVLHRSGRARLTSAGPLQVSDDG